MAAYVLAGRTSTMTRNFRGFKPELIYISRFAYLTRPMKFVRFIKFFVARSSRECYKNRERERESEKRRRERRAGGWISISESKIFASYARADQSGGSFSEMKFLLDNATQIFAHN